MRIALLNLTGGGIGSGYRKYLLNMVPRLASHPAVDSVLCASPYGLNVHDWFENLSNVDFIGCRPFRFMHHRPDSELYGNLKKYRPDVIFIPLERYLKFENIPVVTMVRNMEPLLSPEMPNQLRESEDLGANMGGRHCGEEKQPCYCGFAICKGFHIEKVEYFSE